MDAVIAEYLQERRLLVERMIVLTENAQWYSFDKAVKTIRAEIELIDSRLQHYLQFTAKDYSNAY